MLKPVLLPKNHRRIQRVNMCLSYLEQMNDAEFLDVMDDEDIRMRHSRIGLRRLVEKLEQLGKPTHLRIVGNDCV